MPYCYKCNEPVLFVPTIANGSNEISPKSIPVNISPDPGGTLALLKWPVLFRGTKPANGREPIHVARRTYGDAARLVRILGGSLYRIHFDTCTGRNNKQYGRF